ncbi:predicted protein [Pyrenophora tritici-repentis Pt-1C-BFP]|uniref:Uncharacterized protein n=1 Tax=Pyrenophora tritici-repentis (strain Pt-1C-BFP) TaxID=426418 RepID=B2WI53_PYRTR|nr:uncharacterized protein PTRG_09662 [Pyrenophora tritici-repentis Pt-1C-BFP]EDU42713.1 predicted protein [Pyrenophora tritici-repentis Pt-1C-BFP]
MYLGAWSIKWSMRRNGSETERSRINKVASYARVKNLGYDVFDVAVVVKIDF